jgi:hypothetical protein
MSFCNEINNIEIIMISRLEEILIRKNGDHNDFKDTELYIDIDKTCMTPEKLFARVFNGNYALRNRIMFNTKKLSFGYNDTLIPTRYNFVKFVNICKSTFKYIAYITKRPNSENKKIKEDLSAHNLPIDIDIINKDDIKGNPLGEKFYFIDSDDNTFRDIHSNKKSKNSILFQLSVF